MTFISILQFSGSNPDAVTRAKQTVQNLHDPPPFVVGHDSQRGDVVQFTSEWDDLKSPKFLNFVQTMKDCCGEPSEVLTVALDHPALGSQSGPAAANVVEFAQSFFPVSQVTPDFQTKIEASFQKFDEIFKREAKGDVGLSCGWTTENQKHDDVEGGVAKSLIIIRGWDSMDSFQQSISKKSFQEALPHLRAWNAPHKMWHISRSS